MSVPAVSHEGNPVPVGNGAAKIREEGGAPVVRGGCRPAGRCAKTSMPPAHTTPKLCMKKHDSALMTYLGDPRAVQCRGGVLQLPTICLLLSLCSVAEPLCNVGV